MIGEKWKMAIKTKSKISSPYNDRLSPKDDTSREGAIVIKALDEGFNIVLYQDSSTKNDAYSPKDGELNEDTVCFSGFNQDIC